MVAMAELNVIYKAKVTECDLWEVTTGNDSNVVWEWLNMICEANWKQFVMKVNSIVDPWACVSWMAERGYACTD